jgi:hypothetical protein
MDNAPHHDHTQYLIDIERWGYQDARLRIQPKRQ